VDAVDEVEGVGVVDELGVVDALVVLLVVLPVGSVCVPDWACNAANKSCVNVANACIGLSSAGLVDVGVVVADAVVELVELSVVFVWPTDWVCKAAIKSCIKVPSACTGLSALDVVGVLDPFGAPGGNAPICESACPIKEKKFLDPPLPPAIQLA